MPGKIGPKNAPRPITLQQAADMAESNLLAAEARRRNERADAPPTGPGTDYGRINPSPTDNKFALAKKYFDIGRFDKALLEFLSVVFEKVG